MGIRKMAVFASGGGSGLQAIIDACESGRLSAGVNLVISNNSKSKALQRAKNHNIPAKHFSAVVIPDAEQLNQEMLNTLRLHDVEIIFLAGYLKKLGSNILRAYERKIFNIHPSLLPKYGGQGMYGINVHQAVINAGETETGITIHHVTEEYDTGKIIAQKKISVEPNDTAETLAARVLKEEHVFIVETLENILKI